MRVSKTQIRTDIQSLLADLQIIGLANAERVAAMLREPESDDPHFPSGAYVRLMLGKSDKPDPSERFCNRFYDLKDWVGQQLTNGNGSGLANIRGKLHIPEDYYDPTNKIRFITMPSHKLDLGDVIPVEDDNGLINGMVYIPSDWIGQCHAENCARLFLRRSTNAKYHSPTCRRYEANRRRREKRNIMEVRTK